MNRKFRHSISLALALVALGWASGAIAQSTADGKRTLKAEKLFYKQAGMMEVTLRAMRGTLMMTGYVALDELLKKADELASKVKGIKDIRNRIRVREPDVASAPDDHIAAKLKEAIEEDEDLARADAKGKLNIEIKDGHVTVKGKVTDWIVAQTFVNEVKKVGGVRSLNFDKLKY